MATNIKLSWAGGEHNFHLTIERLRALESTTGEATGTLMLKLRAQTYKTNDIIEIIRHGLIGGGMDEKEAGPLVTSISQQYPFDSLVAPAIAAFGAAMYGTDDPVNADE